MKLMANIYVFFSGQVLYIDGESYSPEFWVEFSMPAQSNFKCISFYHITQQYLYWAFFIAISGVNKFDYALTLYASGA